MSEAFDVRKSDQPFDQSRSLVAVIELSQSSRLVGDMVPGLQRSPLKKLYPDKDGVAPVSWTVTDLGERGVAGPFRNPRVTDSRWRSAAGADCTIPR